MGVCGSIAVGIQSMCIPLELCRWFFSQNYIVIVNTLYLV